MTPRFIVGFAVSARVASCGGSAPQGRDALVEGWMNDPMLAEFLGALNPNGAADPIC